MKERIDFFFLQTINYRLNAVCFLEFFFFFFFYHIFNISTCGINGLNDWTDRLTASRNNINATLYRTNVCTTAVNRLDARNIHTYWCIREDGFFLPFFSPPLACLTGTPFPLKKKKKNSLVPYLSVFPVQHLGNHNAFLHLPQVSPQPFRQRLG